MNRENCQIGFWLSCTTNRLYLACQCFDKSTHPQDTDMEKMVTKSNGGIHKLRWQAREREESPKYYYIKFVYLSKGKEGVKIPST